MCKVGGHFLAIILVSQPSLLLEYFLYWAPKGITSLEAFSQTLLCDF